MGLRRIIAAAMVMGVTMTVAQTANAQEEYLIHSDEPLWESGADNVWPQHFYTDEDFGCTSPIDFGDWKFVARDNENDTEWYRITNYGVFHCWMNVDQADDRDDLSGGRPTFLIRMAKVGSVELWALQIGALPGSDYLLLSRPVGAGSISKFDVLQHECPRHHMRGGGHLDNLITRYCGINTRAAMIALARRMAKLPPLGTLTLQESEADGE